MWTDHAALTPPPWADAWLVSASWLLRLVPQWTWACEDLPESDRGTAGSCGSSTCNFLRKLRAVSRTSCAVSRSDQQCASFPLSTRSPTRVVLLSFFPSSTAIFLGVEWCHNVVLWTWLLKGDREETVGGAPRSRGLRAGTLAASQPRSGQSPASPTVLSDCPGQTV